MFDLRIFLDALLGAALFKGALLTIGLALLVQVATLFIGVCLAQMTRSGRRALRWPARIYVWIFRAAPALLVLLVVWNGLPQLFPIFRQSWYSPFLAAFIGLTLVQSAYAAEIIRAAIGAVPHGQTEAATALGLSRVKTQALVVMPQAFRIALPPLSNEFIALLKATSLATVIALKELMTVTQYAIAASFRFLEWYAAALVYYLVLVAVISAVQGVVEGRLERAYRR